MNAFACDPFRRKRVVISIVSFLCIYCSVLIKVWDLLDNNEFIKIIVWPLYVGKVWTPLKVLKVGGALVVISALMWLPSVVYIIRGFVGCYLISMIMMVLWMAFGLNLIFGGA